MGQVLNAYHRRQAGELLLREKSPGFARRFCVLRFLNESALSDIVKSLFSREIQRPRSSIFRRRSGFRYAVSVIA